MVVWKTFSTLVMQTPSTDPRLQPFLELLSASTGSWSNRVNARSGIGEECWEGEAKADAGVVAKIGILGGTMQRSNRKSAHEEWDLFKYSVTYLDT